MLRKGPPGLARTSHQPSAAASHPSALTALRSVGLLNSNFGDRRHNLEIPLRIIGIRLHGLWCLSPKLSRRLATRPGEKSGLGSEFERIRNWSQ